LQISFEITVAVMISICCKYNKWSVAFWKLEWQWKCPLTHFRKPLLINLVFA
jgi:hypothetical protein